MRWKVRHWNTDLHMCAPWYMHSHAPSHTHTCTKQTLKTLNDKAWLERTKPTWPLALPVLICESLCPLSTDAHTCALESGMFKVLLHGQRHLCARSRSLLCFHLQTYWWAMDSLGVIGKVWADALSGSDNLSKLSSNGTLLPSLLQLQGTHDLDLLTAVCTSPRY